MIVEQNPSTAGGTMKILTEISKYVPEGFQVPIHGDQKTVELVYTAKIAGSTAEIPKHRLQEFQPVPQEFHFRSLVMKVCVNSR